LSTIRRLVLDVLKPHEPTIVDLAGILSELDGVDNVNISIYEIDRQVENAKITLEGDAIHFETVVETIKANGGAVHSIDEVAAGQKIIDDAVTPQDPTQ
jgi:hypothetical protein